MNFFIFASRGLIITIQIRHYRAGHINAANKALIAADYADIISYCED